jgi:Zn-dependent protease with chaperone function
MPEMTTLYPAGPQLVPEKFTSPSRGYQRQAWLALAALSLFVGSYLGLTGWLVYTTYGYLAGALAGGAGAVRGYLAAAPLLFLSIFMLKAMIFRDKGGSGQDFPVTPEQEPGLFAFLNRIADEAGAPRPHKVFLSPGVNAGVFYDFSVLNLIIPLRRNLTIGLGLVNALSLSEFKAVLAHEFGHFGQRSMAIGRWVHTAQRVAASIVTKRDFLDGILLGISRSDFRIAWIGWIMRVVVWSLRSVLDTLFSMVVLAERALSREMEFQADLVAVSLAGSDAIVHALHKLNPADAAFDQAAGLVLSEHHEGRAVNDLYVLQTRIVEHMASLLADKRYGVTPPVPEDSPEAHRVFEKRMAAPPRMWSSHPPNDEREENAKHVYIPAPADGNPAWQVFGDPATLRQRMTRFLVDMVMRDPDAPRPPKRDAPPAPVDGLAAVARVFGRNFLDPRYRGVYLNRSAVRAARTPGDLFPNALPLRDAWAEPYTQAMADSIARLKSVQEECDTLLGLQRGLLKAGSGAIRFRGRVLRRRELPDALQALENERNERMREVAAHDQRVRGIHLAAAQSIGQGWPEVLRAAAALLHYADHNEANLNDLYASYRNVLDVITVDGKVSKSEAKRLIAVGCELQMAMIAAHAQARLLGLPKPVLNRLEVESWQKALPEAFDFPLPDASNLGDWCGAVGGWVASMAGPFDALERVSLEHLLDCEAQIMRMAQGMEPVQAAPTPAQVPAQYPTLPPGAEREKQWKLGWWDRFQIGDGILPTVSRFAVAGVVVAITLRAVAAVGVTTIAVHNGLERDVRVAIGSHVYQMSPHESYAATIPHQRHFPVVASTESGEVIEQFTADLPHPLRTYVYNVASADALIRWTAVYGHASASDERGLGAPRWATTDAVVLFGTPPTSVKTKGGGHSMAVLSAPDVEPSSLLDLIERPDEKQATLEAHARWDVAGKGSTVDWVDRAADLPNVRAIIEHRLRLDPGDVLALRLQQDTSKGEEHKTVCQSHQAQAAREASNPTFAYLAARCVQAGPEQEGAFLTAYQAHPQYPWLALAAGSAAERAGDTARALSILEPFIQNSALPKHVTIEIARLLRLAGRAADARELAKISPVLAIELELEKGDQRDSVRAAYSALLRGDLNRAWEIGAQTPQRTRLLRLIAASTNAPKEIVQEALDLKDSEAIDWDTLWPALGLALREKRNVTGLKDAIGKIAGAEDEARLLRCVEALEARVRPGAMEKLMRGLLVVPRGHVLVMACVAMGDRAPKAWREAARQGLFATERPWL